MVGERLFHKARRESSGLARILTRRPEHPEAPISACFLASLPCGAEERYSLALIEASRTSGMGFESIRVADPPLCND
jgi:hypothetical protein